MKKRIRRGENPFHRQLLCPISFFAFSDSSRTINCMITVDVGERMSERRGKTKRSRFSCFGNSFKRSRRRRKQILSPWSIVYLCLCLVRFILMEIHPESRASALRHRTVELTSSICDASCWNFGFAQNDDESSGEGERRCSGGSKTCTFY